VLCCFLESKFSWTMVCCVVAFCFATTLLFFTRLLANVKFSQVTYTIYTSVLMVWGHHVFLNVALTAKQRSHLPFSRCRYALHFSHVPEEATSAPSIQKPCIIQLLMNPNGVDDVRFHLAYQSSKAMFFVVFSIYYWRQCDKHPP
jgi:hypothetical protein